MASIMNSDGRTGIREAQHFIPFADMVRRWPGVRQLHTGISANSVIGSEAGIQSVESDICGCIAYPYSAILVTLPLARISINVLNPDGRNSSPSIAARRTR